MHLGRNIDFYYYKYPICRKIVERWILLYWEDHTTNFYLGDSKVII